MGSVKARLLVMAGLVILSFALITGSALAKSKEGERPGWGWGDTNHEHQGPPGGGSVHPVFP